MLRKEKVCWKTANIRNVAVTNLTFYKSFTVYLPQGVWKDGIDGSLRKGSRWIHNYKVPKDKIAFFIKMPDNTRF